jgi:hypothetical protein
MMWLPTKLYESLPALYIAVGASLLLGALYSGLMFGYLALGASSILGGMLITYIRHKARSEEAHSSSPPDTVAM